MLGYTQWNAPEILQIASFTGVYGVSFVVSFAGASIGWAFAEPGVKKGVLHMLAAALVFACVYGYGHKVLPAKPLGEMRQPLLSLNTALIQPNIDQYKKWSPQYEEKYTRLFEDIAARSGAYQFIGSNVEHETNQYVGAYLLPPNAAEWQNYRKIKLVPFGEYIPLENLVRSAFNNVEVLGELGAFTPGPREQKPLDVAGVSKGQNFL